ncbi:heparinase II/III family protein [Hamadaea sp. NPDC051192]|uniref:heparinase II/III family protein n=1 Tax=Hamadaea sp. NPDC051192 TaxID=3154940 RepID=UPI0034306987
MAESVFPAVPGQLTSLSNDIAAVAADDAPLPVLGFSAYNDFFVTGNRMRYEKRYFRRRARLNALAAQALLDPDADVSRLADVLWAVCDEHTWALPAHIHYGDRDGWGADQTLDLFAAETAHALAEIVTGLGPRLDPLVSQRVRAEVDRRVLTPLADPRPLAWEGFGNNWESVCAGAAGMAAMLLVPPSDRLSSMLARCGKAMDRFLAGYGDDGGCPEGVDYWVYGFGYFVYYAVMLHEQTGVDLLDDPKVAQIAAFPHKAALGGGAYAPFSDASERPWLPAGLLSRLAERFGTPPPAVIPSFHDDHCYRWAHLARTLAWYRPSSAASTVADSDFLPDLAWVVDRGPDAVFAAKGGHNDEPHNHIDLGAFLLHVRGRTVLADLGAGEYTRSYFSDTRYDHLHPSARAHSIPVVDGELQLPGAARLATVVRHEVLPGGVAFDLDLTAAYEVEGLRRLIRRFRWWRTGRLELTDVVTADRPLPITEVFVSRYAPVVTEAAVRWDDTVTLDVDRPVSLDPLEATDHHGRPDAAYRVLVPVTAPVGESAHTFTFTVR